MKALPTYKNRLISEERTESTVVPTLDPFESLHLRMPLIKLAVERTADHFTFRTERRESTEMRWCDGGIGMMKQQPLSGGTGSSEVELSASIRFPGIQASCSQSRGFRQCTRVGICKGNDDFPDFVRILEDREQSGQRFMLVPDRHDHADFPSLSV